MVGSKQFYKGEGRSMKRLLVPSLCVLLLLSSTGKIRAAGEYPVKPITCIIPMEAGADGDIIMRPLMEKAAAILGKPIMIVNKPGGGHTIAYREILKAKPDGYTIGTYAVTLVTNKLQGLLPYDHNDFTLIGNSYIMSELIVASTKTNRPFKTFKEVSSFAKSHPGEVSIASTATGGASWVGAMLLEIGTGLKFNIIPQAGSGAFVITQVAGGHTDLGIAGIPAAKGQIEAGNICPIAGVGPQRYPGKYNYIPTLTDLGYNISFHSFGGVIAPPKMPKDIADKLIEAFKIATNNPEFQKFLVEREFSPFYLPPDELSNFCEEKKKVYRLVFDKAGLLKEK
jgi:tripartite-type tricarboxylate transporter receptor subunit TctC